LSGSGSTERLPRLLGTREHAARKIADRIRAFEQLRRNVATGNITDLEDEAESNRRYTIELLRSLFDSPQPAGEFDHETARGVFYTDPSDEERRADLSDDLRNDVSQLRNLTARLEFYEPGQEGKPAESAEKSADHQADDHRPALMPILLFLLVLILTAGLVLWQRESIAQLSGPAQATFYLLISLVPAILLFGLFRTIAKATGKIYGLSVELGGPTALFIIVLLILLRLPAPASPTTTADKPPAAIATMTTTSAPIPTTTTTTRPEPHPPTWTRFHVTIHIPDGCTAAHLTSGYQYCVTTPQSIPSLRARHVRIIAIHAHATGIARHLPDMNGQVVASDLGFDWDVFISTASPLAAGERVNTTWSPDAWGDAAAPLHVRGTLNVHEANIGTPTEYAWWIDYEQGTSGGKPVFDKVTTNARVEFDAVKPPTLQVLLWTGWGGTSEYRLNDLSIEIVGATREPEQ
jgi:hypothetical protein